MRDLGQAVWVCHALVHRRGGERVQAVAVVAQEPGTDRRMVLDRNKCPWEGESDVVIAALPAHWLLEVFRVWEWPEPSNILDLYAEYRVATNDFSEETADPDIQAALHPIPNALSCSDRQAVDLGIGEKHCLAAVAGLTLLLSSLEFDEASAFRRGRYAAAVAAMQDRGLPINDALRRDAENLRRLLLAAKSERGANEDLRHALLKTDQLLRLPVAADGRSRVELRPYAAKTGRNQPRQYGWQVARCLISPPPGRALAVIDYTAQEFGIAANLSGDAAMIADYYAGDAYRSFGERVGVSDRALLKAVLLPLMYGQPAVGIAKDTNIAMELAHRIEQTHRQVYRRFWQWIDEAKQFFLKRGSMYSMYGWLLHATPGDPVPMQKRLRTVANFPIQANGSEILWEACRRLHHVGVELCGVNHDAFMVEADVADIADVVRVAEEALAEASADVVGRPLRTDTEVVLPGERLRKGQRDWDRLQAVAAAEEAMA